MNRRRFLAGSLALPLASLGPAWAGDGFPIADMHYHQFFPGTLPVSMGPVKPLAKVMADGNVTLLAWSLVGDQPWITRGPRGLTQKGTPEAGAAQTWFEREAGRVKAHVAEQGLKLALTPADIDKALAGEPHVVLAVEGATFLDDDVANLEKAYALGVRHLQLVHYIRNVIGDFQTEAPEHQGLTERGKAVVSACNRLGILIDLAHATAPVVRQVLALSKAPVVWSHSFVARRATDWTMPMPRTRHIALADAKAIAAQGGVVGLWAMRQDSGPTPDGYGRRLAELAAMLGEDHVGVGTDLGAIAQPAVAKLPRPARGVRLHATSRHCARGAGEDCHRQLCARTQGRVAASILIFAAPQASRKLAGAAGPLFALWCSAHKARDCRAPVTFIDYQPGNTRFEADFMLAYRASSRPRGAAMPFKTGDKVRLRGSSQELTIVRIVGANAHCCVTRADKSTRNTLLRLSDLELVRQVEVSLA